MDGARACSSSSSTADASIFLSGEIDARVDGTDAVLLSVALTETPAQCGALPAIVLHGGLDDRGSWSLQGLERDLVDHAIERLRDRRTGKPIVIEDPPRTLTIERAGGVTWVDGEPLPVEGRPVGPLMYRAGTILSVR